MYYVNGHRKLGNIVVERLELSFKGYMEARRAYKNVISYGDWCYVSLSHDFEIIMDTED